LRGVVKRAILCAKNVAFIALATSLLLVSMSYPQATASQQIGRGDFTLPIVDRNGLTGKTLTLSDFLGKVIVLDFMAPWCTPCQQLTPFMEDLYAQFAGGGVVFIEVAEPWWNSDYQNVTIEQFLTEYNSSLTYVLDTATHWGQVGTMYGIQSVPTLFILYRNGTVGYTFNGAGNIKDNAVASIGAAQAAPVPEFSGVAVVAFSALAASIYLLRRKRL
jgi:thiol-disulfide isomerase/thioredoxin